MGRVFLRPEDLGELVAQEFGADRRLEALDRLTGGTKKGVYRLHLDDRTTAVLYVWAAGENYWPPSACVPDDPFTDASGADLFAAAHTALCAARVRTPRLLMLDRDRRHLDADLALVEDVGVTRLESLIESDRHAASATLSALGDSLRGMHAHSGSAYGKVAVVAQGAAPQTRRTEDIVVDRALTHLDAAASRDARMAAAQVRVAAHMHDLRSTVSARQTYGLVHGELGPDHVLVTPAGEPVVIDIEGLAYFDIEWDHAWLQTRFGEDYPALNPVDLDPHRLELFRFAQVLSLIEGPLRIADTDYPDRQWMLDLAERNIAKALASV
ncbi:phosphotransferase [Kineosporia sp. A_224]|uniref:phosphotransferase family protein n=1 Tax=Kineosporia sp. A_224 TaxID=1962180 RepID=UPI000B4B3F83